MDNFTTNLLAAALIIVGLSFLWKSILAIFLGQVTYWEGFIPLSILSIFVCHLPPKKNSLIKNTRTWWVHFTVGPLFFFLSMALLAAGADQLGYPGSETVNTILTLGRTDIPAPITYSRTQGYKLNFIKTVSDALYKAATQKVLQEEAEKNKL